MTAFVNHFGFEFRSGLRNPSIMLMNYLFPLAFYAFMGLVMTRINPDFVQSIIPAMIIFAGMASTFLGLPGPLVQDRETGVFRTYKINHVPALSILAVPTLATVIHTVIAALIVTLTAGPLFGAQAPVHLGWFLAILLLTVLTFGALGALIGVVSADARATVLWSQLLFLPSMMMGGLIMPLDILPDTLARLAGLLPPAHAMQAFMGLAYGAETTMNPVVSVMVLAATALLATCLAIYLFNWDQDNRSRRGHPLLGLLVLAPMIVGVLTSFG